MTNGAHLLIDIMSKKAWNYGTLKIKVKMIITYITAINSGKCRSAYNIDSSFIYKTITKHVYLYMYSLVAHSAFTCIICARIMPC